jgi:hypothetical protein
LIPAACAVITPMSWPLRASQSATDRLPPDATSLSSSGENAAAWNTCFELVTCGPIASEIWPRSPRYMSAALIHRWVRMLAT